MTALNPDIAPAALDAVVDELDEDLLDAARSGDQASIDELCRRHHPAAVRIAGRHATHDYPAQDLAADAVMRLLRALAHGEGPRGSVRAYLAVTIRNLAASAARRRAHAAHPQSVPPETLHHLTSSPGHGQDPEQAMLRAEASQALSVAMAALHPSARQVLLLQLVDYMSVQQCARHLGTTPDAVRSMSYRARKALRRHLLARWPEPVLDF
ncbi:RNA polymerase sigma factor [Monashia sp. NPDC004114]